ncbi:unnamed protein product [Adineta ricciae]|uniref:F-box domain-containing protein n=1 Tax=Adineta ricciae TaxID=249248 RepID=A0A814J682_ADIRI|nr:unnamed protein product [Adineta ricciae]
MSNLLLMDLPVEMLHRIFDELDVYTIISSVRGVCRQLRDTVNSYNRFKLKFSSIEESRLKFVSRHIQPSNVISLDLVGGHNDEGCIRVFLQNFNINQFNRLRSLTIEQAHNIGFADLLSNVSTDLMFSLTINAPILRPETFSIILQLIIGTNLRKLNLNSFTYKPTIVSWPIQNTLEQLTISGCSYDGYRLIVANSHGLRKLIIKNGLMSGVGVAISSYATVGLDSTKRQRISNDSQVLDSQLSSLTIESCRILIQNLECYLSLTRSLVHMKLVLSRSILDSLFEGSFWEQLIRNNLPVLIKFEFCLTCENIEFNAESTFDSIVSPFQSPFWLQDKKWFVACDYILRTSELVLYTTPICVKTGREWTTLRASSLSPKCYCHLGWCENQFDPIESKTFSKMNLVSSKISDNILQYITLALLDQKTIKTLKLSHNQIGDMGAKQLADALQNHQVLTDLDLSYNNIGNDGAKYLYYKLKDNKTLTRLDLKNNPGKYCQFVSLNFRIRSYEGLVEIRLNSKCIDDDGMIFLSEVLFNSPIKLFSLDLSHNEIGDSGVQRLADTLRNNQILCTLDLSNNKITNFGFQYIYDILKENQSLKELELKNNPSNYCVAMSAAIKIRANGKTSKMNLSGENIGDEGIKYISEALHNNQRLIELDISNNAIGDIGVKYLSDALKHNQTLTKLILRVDREKKEWYDCFSYQSKSSPSTNCENRISEEGTKYLADALETNKTLRNLDLSGNRTGDAGVKYLANSLQKNQLKELILANQYKNYQIGDLGAQYLADALKQNTCLTKLDLSSNQIGDTGAQYLADALRNNQTLITLNLESNLIQNTGLEYLHNALKDNQTLKELKLAKNPGSFGMAVSAAIQIRNNQAITTISVQCGSIDDESIKFVSEALLHNQTLIELNLSSNKLGDIAMRNLCNVLQNNTTLTSIDVSGNQFGDNGVKYLADVLKNSKTLIKLIVNSYDFNDNRRVSDIGARYLAEALKTNKTLQELELNMNPRGYCAVLQEVVKARNKNITTIDLGGYEIKSEELQYLVSELQHNQTLTALNLRGNSLGQNEARYLSDLLRNNKTLKELDLTYNEIRDTGIQYLANALYSNTTLTTLTLDETKIGHVGAKHLANALRNNRTLLTLDIKSNHIHDIGVQHLASALRTNRTLEVLKVGNNSISNKLRSQLTSEDQRWCFTIERRRPFDEDEWLYYESD